MMMKTQLYKLVLCIMIWSSPGIFIGFTNDFALNNGAHGFRGTIIGAAAQNVEEDEDFGTLVAVTAVRGATARLPCEVTAPNADDPVLLVLWYKNASVTPVYSYDSRGKANGQQKDVKAVARRNRKPQNKQSSHTASNSESSNVKLQQWGDEEVWGVKDSKTESKQHSTISQTDLDSNDKTAISSTRHSDKHSPGSKSRSFFPGQSNRPRTRAWFDVSSSPAQLLIRDVSGRDEGSYRCKVHFRYSPSWSQRITLTVTDPPGFPRIQTESGLRLEGPIGPYEDGTEVHMVCTSSGEPPPHLAWSSNVVSLTPSPPEVTDSTVRTRVKVVANRKTVDQTVSCTAANSSSTSAIAASEATVSVSIKVNLAPLSVQLVTPAPYITGSAESTFECRVVGARPSTEVQWWLSGRQLTQHAEMTRVDANVSVSTIRLVAEPGDDNARLVCKAYSTNLPGTVLQDQAILTVHYIPVATLNVVTGNTPRRGGGGGTGDGTAVHRGSAGEGSNVIVREGTSVALTCQIQANPSVYNVSWFHNGKPVLGSTSVAVDRKLLRLRGIGAHQSGLYTCVGSNAEGDGQSNAVNINVEYAPVCAENQQREYIVPRGTSVTVACEVKAYPSTITFTWAKKTLSADATRLPNVGRPEGSMGRYTLTNVQDDQTEILCWAKNNVGTQKSPCTFHVIAQGRPGPVNNCSVTNHTASGFVVSCNGWRRRGSPLDANYTLLVYNQYGRSNPELIGEIGGGNLVPSVTNYKSLKNKSKGQHHPGMTVAEIGLHNTVDFHKQRVSTGSDDVSASATASTTDVPQTSVLTSLGDLVRNMTNIAPFFVVGGLKGGREFAVVVTASNIEGVSPPVALSAFTLKDNAQTVIGLHGNIGVRLPPNIPIVKSESGSASIDKNGHGTLTSNYDHVSVHHPGIGGESDGRGGSNGGGLNTGETSGVGMGAPGRSRAQSTEWMFIPPIFLVLAASLVAIIMIATIVIFSLRRRGRMIRRRELQQAARVGEEQEFMQQQQSSRGSGGGLAADAVEGVTTLGHTTDTDTDKLKRKSNNDTDDSSNDIDDDRFKGDGVADAGSFTATTEFSCTNAAGGVSASLDNLDSTSHELLIAPGSIMGSTRLGPDTSSGKLIKDVTGSGLTVGRTGPATFRLRRDGGAGSPLMGGTMTAVVPCSGTGTMLAGTNSLEGIRKSSYLASTPNLATITGGGLDSAVSASKSMLHHNVRPIMCHATLGRMPDGDRSAGGIGRTGTLAVLEVDTLQHNVPQMLPDMSVLNPSFSSTLLASHVPQYRPVASSFAHTISSSSVLSRAPAMAPASAGTCPLPCNPSNVDHSRMKLTPSSVGYDRPLHPSSLAQTSFQYQTRPLAPCSTSSSSMSVSSIPGATNIPLQPPSSMSDFHNIGSFVFMTQPPATISSISSPLSPNSAAATSADREQAHQQLHSGAIAAGGFKRSGQCISGSICGSADSKDSYSHDKGAADGANIVGLRGNLKVNSPVKSSLKSGLSSGHRTVGVTFEVNTQVIDDANVENTKFTNEGVSSL